VNKKQFFRRLVPEPIFKFETAPKPPDVEIEYLKVNEAMERMVSFRKSLGVPMGAPTRERVPGSH
jgi:hypothetical protein